MTSPNPVTAKRDWCCGTPIAGPHISGCAYEPREESAVEPPSAPNPPSGPAPAAASSVRAYGFKRAVEFDLDLPSGDLVRVRKLNMNHIFALGITDLRDAFVGDLLSDGDGQTSGEEESAQKGFAEALLDPERRAKLMGPIDRVVVAAVVCPTVVFDGESNGEQTNVNDVDFVDKVMIFNEAAGDVLAAFGGQQEALKSLQPGPQASA